MASLHRLTLLVLTALMVTTAGCGFITGSEPLSFAAEPATVNDSVQASTGYEQTNVSDNVVVREFSAAGQSRSVEVTNKIAQYERSVDLPVVGSQRAAVFAVISSPEVAVLEQNFNPIEDMTPAELIDRIESAYDSLEVGEEVGSGTAIMLGDPITVTRFDGSAMIAGEEVPVYVEVTDVVNHRDDFVFAVGVYPQSLSGEEDNVETLIEGVRH